MGCSNVQNFSTRSPFWEKRLSSKTFKGPWPPNSLVWWPKIYISIEGYSRPFQRCMTLHISMLYMVGRASERSFQKWVFLWTTKFWTCWCCFWRLFKTFFWSEMFIWSSNGGVPIIFSKFRDSPNFALHTEIKKTQGTVKYSKSFYLPHYRHE